MTKIEFEEALKVLERYYILEELQNKINPIFDEINKLVTITDSFPLIFDEKIDKKYSINKDIEKGMLGEPYISKYYIKDVASMLYFFQTLRNYVYAILKEKPIDALANMIYDVRRQIAKKCDFFINNHTWMTNDYKNCSKYYETLQKTPKSLRILLNEFDESTNPFITNDFDDCIKYVTDVALYKEGSRENCVRFTIKDDISIKKYCRKEHGFIYSQKIISNNLYLGHYFNQENGEIVSICLENENDKIIIKYNLTKRTISMFEKERAVTEKDIKFLNDTLLHFVLINNKNHIKQIIIKH